MVIDKTSSFVKFVCNDNSDFRMLSTNFNDSNISNWEFKILVCLFHVNDRILMCLFHVNDRSRFISKSIGVMI